MNTSDSPSGVPQALTPEDRTWGMLAHFAALAFLILPPIGGIIGPLVVWLAKREHSAFTAEAGKEALNFNITVVLGYAVCAIFAAIFIGFLLALALWLYWLVMTLVAGIKASEGVHYRYPIALRIVK